MHPVAPPGWYPDPSGGPGQRWFNGWEWTGTDSGEHRAPKAQPAPPAVVEAKPELNAFFVMLTVISAMPTAYFGLLYANGQNTIAGILFLWSAAWTYVWWSLRHR